jgi:hypothetical protein
MTEDEWLSGTDPVPMLNSLGAAPSDRRCLLLVMAYLDRIWNFSVPGPIRDWAEQARLAVDGTGDPDAFEASERAVCDHICACRPGYLREGFSGWAYEALASLFFFAQADEDQWEPVDEPEELSELAVQADYLRDIFGNPWRPVTIDPAWLTPKVLSLAQSIYQDRAFGRMPILGDVLEEAGCDNTEILAHCRSQSEHVRGCWVVDAILGKS